VKVTEAFGVGTTAQLEGVLELVLNVQPSKNPVFGGTTTVAAWTPVFDNRAETSSTRTEICNGFANLCTTADLSGKEMCFCILVPAQEN
jgi:hypothetical protein